jgi:sucrose phosphorylase
VDAYRGRIPRPRRRGLDERDSLLISYADQVQDEGLAPLRSLARFCESRLGGLVSGVHILPFYPWSSDDGFSVKDYRAVDPALGSWQDIESLGKSFRLMFDGVINHASAQGAWFEGFLRDEEPYRDYFITVEGQPELSQVVRPRALPLLTEYSTAAGPRKLWTTFGADQVDLNFRNPGLLIEIFDILLQYARRGAEFIRLDAIAYLWKQPGTSCIHLPQTHALVQLLRVVLDEVAPHVQLVTETNVPHRDNIAYFGDGRNEAQLVYNFALPPLVLHTFHSADAGVLSDWASGLSLPSDRTTFLNFLASHDGVGLNPARGILRDAELAALVERTQAHGGLISYKQDSDGTQSPYELNVNFFDALSDPAGREAVDTQVDRFMGAQAIMLSLLGMPGIYFHSLFGSRGWAEGPEQSGQKRAINRQKLRRDALERELADQGTLRSKVFTRFRELLRARSSSAAFHPHGGQEVLDLGREVFAVLRSSPDRTRQVLCLQNVTAKEVQVANPLTAATPMPRRGRSTKPTLTLRPYQTRWID